MQQVILLQNMTAKKNLHGNVNKAINIDSPFLPGQLEKIDKTNSASFTSFCLINNYNSTSIFCCKQRDTIFKTELGHTASLNTYPSIRYNF